MRSVIKHKSKCKFCKDAIVFSESCDKVIAHYKCAVDNEDMSYRCQKGFCTYYEREENKEEKK